jgi:hypothetical protein
MAVVTPALSSMTSLPVLQARIGTTRRRGTAPAPRPRAITAADLLLADTRFPEQYFELSEAGAELPSDSFFVNTLYGGPQVYIGSTGHSNRHAPWWYRLSSASRQAYVVWGRPATSQKEAVIYPIDRQARTSNGRGVVYSHWPIIGDDGQIDEYSVRVTQVEFRLLRPTRDKGAKLVVKTAHSRYRSGNATEAPTLSWYRLDDHWRNLITTAQDSFYAHCSAGLPPDVEQWRTWFLGQREQAEVWRDYFRSQITGRGWLAALDSVKEAWQLPIALGEYRRLFPEVPPDPDAELSPELLRQPRPDSLTALAVMPRYEGTTGSMEGRLLEAYYRLRPEGRRTELERWMADYGALISNLRNYTGD